MNEPREGAPFPLKAVAQICIIVPDIDEAVRSWWEIFGVGPWHIYTYGRPLVKHMTRCGEPTDYRMKVALSYIGDMRVELIEPLEGATVRRRATCQVKQRHKGQYAHVQPAHVVPVLLLATGKSFLERSSGKRAAGVTRFQKS